MLLAFRNGHPRTSFLAVASSHLAALNGFTRTFESELRESFAPSPAWPWLIPPGFFPWRMAWAAWLLGWPPPPFPPAWLSAEQVGVYGDERFCEAEAKIAQLVAMWMTGQIVTGGSRTLSNR
jgi:hypothetical protein